MTTDWRTLLGAAAIALAAWFGGLALVAYALEPSREIIVWAPPSRLGPVLAASPVLVLDSRGGFLRLRGESPGFVGALYSSGAWLVLPALAGGCRGR